MTSGYILSTFEPLWPPVAPTPEHCFEGMKATDSDFAMCVPSFIEVSPAIVALCSDSHLLRLGQSMQIVSSGSLPKMVLCVIQLLRGQDISIDYSE